MDDTNKIIDKGIMEHWLLRRGASQRLVGISATTYRRLSPAGQNTQNWSMAIPRTKAVEYVKKHGTDPNSGFFEHKGNVILSHNGGKITFSQQEGNAVVELIKAACPEE